MISTLRIDFWGVGFKLLRVVFLGLLLNLIVIELGRLKVPSILSGFNFVTIEWIVARFVCFLMESLGWYELKI